MSIRNKKISTVRFDKSNFNEPTLNRALDNIINNINPFIDDTVNTVNAIEQQIDTIAGGSGITLNVQGASPINGSALTVSGSGGITFGSNGSDTFTIFQGASQITVAAADTAGSVTGNSFQFSGSGGATVTRSGTTLTINQGAPPAQTITFNVSGSNTISGSTFQLSGANGISLTGTAPNTLVIDASGVPPTGPAGGVLGYAGSTYPNPNGLAASVAGGGLVPDKLPLKQGNLGLTLKYDSFTEAAASNRELAIEGADAYSFPNPLAGGGITIQGGMGNTQPVVMNGDGGGAILAGGIGVGAGNGGIARVIGGYAGNSGVGGETQIFGGNGPAGRNGGAVLIRGGENFFQNATGGSVTIRGGDGTTDGTVNIGLTTTTKVNIGAATIPTEVYGDLSGSVISASVNIIAPTITGSQISSSNFIGWGNRIVRPYGAFCDLNNQTASATTVAYPMNFTTTEEAIGVSIVSGSRITFAYDGVYNIQFSAQIQKTNASAAEIDIWLSETGSNVPRSNTAVYIQGNNASNVAAWNFVRTFSSGSYAEILWRTDDTDAYLHFQTSGSSPDRPEIPSTILTVTQV